MTRPGAGEADRRRWTLVAVCAATAMLLLDVTVVNVALPAIGHDLGAGLEELQWVIDAYALTLAAVLLSAGTLADRIGRRRVFLAGLWLFTAASLGCGLAPDAVTLDVMRGVQGVGGAVLYATSLALIAQEFHGRDRGVAFGVWGAVSGVAIAAGPLAGGALADGPGWEWVFLVNVPVGLATIALTRAKLAEGRAAVPDPVDRPGLLTFAVALFCLVFALIRGNGQGWGAPETVVPLAVAVACLAAFVAIELRSPAPMLDLRLFRIPTFSGVAAVALTQSVAIYPLFFWIALYMQGLLGHTPLETGVRFLPMTALILVVAPLAGRVQGRVPSRALLAGSLVGLAAGLLLMRGLAADDEWTALLPGMVVGGLAIGVISPSLASSAVGVVGPERAGMASGINNTFRQVGIALGIAGLGAVFTAHADETVLVAPAASAASAAAFLDGVDAILLVAAVVALAGALLAALLVRESDFHAAARAGTPLSSGG